MTETASKRRVFTYCGKPIFEVGDDGKVDKILCDWTRERFAEVLVEELRLHEQTRENARKTLRILG